MTTRELIELVDELGGRVEEAKFGDVLLVGCNSRWWQIERSAIKLLAKDELRDIFTGKREPQCIVQLTRIVGYYSTTNNWNKSKLAELEDRRRGDYALGRAS